MDRVRTLFHALVAVATTGTGLLLLSAWEASAATPDPGSVLMLVPLGGVASLAGIWAGTLSILGPPSLTASDRRLGRGVLVALTVAGPVTLFLAGAGG
jgi:hypothetical protein